LLYRGSWIFLVLVLVIVLVIVSFFLFLEIVIELIGIPPALAGRKILTGL